MANIFKRLERIARSMVDDFSDESNNESSTEYHSAWDELNAFLGTERSKPSATTRRTAGTGPRAQDYANLEADPGMSDAELKKQYKNLLIKYHPDKFTSHPEKLAIATEITVKLNESYRRIMKERSQ